MKPKVKGTGKFVVFIVFLILFTLISALVLALTLFSQKEALLVRDGAESFLNSKEPTFVNTAANDIFNAEPKKEEKTGKFHFTSPEGIEFVSHSDAWNQAKLEDLYNELLLNKHGEEIYSLSKVIVYAEAEERVAASHQNDLRKSKLSLNHPALPKSYSMTFREGTSIITLYDGDEDNSIESMASDLSHEYGHLYTLYYMFEEDNIATSEYARLRGFDPEKVEYYVEDYDEYLDMHHWYAIEIAAEDYVALMGSPTGRTVEDYIDVTESFNDPDYVTIPAQNLMVQENMMIPIATHVEGLAEYFYSFIDEEAPEYLPKADMNINVSASSKSYNFTTGYQRIYTYTITWDKAYGEDAIYTLVSFTEDDYYDSITPVKTVYPGERAVAYAGSATREYNNRVHIRTDNIANGTKYLAVSVITPEGHMYLSDPISYTF